MNEKRCRQLPAAFLYGFMFWQEMLWAESTILLQADKYI